MSFSSEWDNIYLANQQLSIWPWSDLVSYVMRYSKPATEKFKVLELGCGAGANILFFKNLKVDYYAVEGSASAVNYLVDKNPYLSEKIKVADFTKEIPFDVSFDLIFDRASITHNKTNDIKNCISLFTKYLKPGGIFIGVDWFSTSHSEFKNGVFCGDENTKNEFSDGQFYQVGDVHFSNNLHLKELFKEFEFIKLEHKIVTQEFPQIDYQFASWNFAVKKSK
jgi:SAM-dependent methyltransferase